MSVWPQIKTTVGQKFKYKASEKQDERARDDLFQFRCQIGIRCLVKFDPLHMLYTSKANTTYIFDKSNMINNSKSI